MTLEQFLNNMNTVKSDACNAYCRNANNINADYEEYSGQPYWWNDQRIVSWHVRSFKGFIAFYFDLEA